MFTNEQKRLQMQSRSLAKGSQSSKMQVGSKCASDLTASDAKRSARWFFLKQRVSTVENANGRKVERKMNKEREREEEFQACESYMTYFLESLHVCSSDCYSPR